MDPIIPHIRAEYEQLRRDLAAVARGARVDLTDRELGLLRDHAARLKALLTRIERVETPPVH